MNNKGVGPIPFILLVFAVIIGIPLLFMMYSGISKIIFQVIMVFIIIAYVRNMGIDGPLMWIISGILIYFLVYKYIYLTTATYIFMVLLGFGVTSAMMWGGNFIRNKYTYVWSKKE